MLHKGRLLLLEDDRLFSETLVDFLQEEGFEIESAFCATEAIEKTYGSHYDLYLFDVKLPDQNGFDLLRSLRNSGDTTPTIYLTSAKEKEAIQKGFDSGGDDYMKKPIDLDELLWRIQARLRNTQAVSRITLGPFDFDMDRLVLYRDGHPVAMPKKQAELLALFLRHRGEVLSHDEILQELYGQTPPSSGVLRVYINKLKQIFGKESICNIRGMGYCFEK